MNIPEYLDKLGLQWKRRGEEAVMQCPFCGQPEKNFAINLVSGSFNCLNLNTCGIRGGFNDFRKHFGDKPIKQKGAKAYGDKQTSYKKPAEDVPEMDESQIGVYRYLKGRGFSDATIKHFRLGASGDVVKFPYLKNNVLVNIKFRDVHDKKKMWQVPEAEPTLFNRDNITSNTLIITEGEYDAMAFYEYGIEATSVPNGAKGMSWIDNEWDYLSTFDKIILCFDNDGAGRDGLAEMAKRIGLWRCYSMELPYKDANECLKKQLPADLIFKSVDEATEINPESIVKPSFFTDRIRRIFEAGNKMFGIPTAWEELTSILKGWRDGEVTVWTGRNSSGKSTLLNQHFLDMAAKHIKTGIYSGEMPPDKYLRWAVVQGLENDQPSFDQMRGFLNWLSDRVYVLNVTGSIDPQQLLDDFEYMARRYGVKHFIVDSLMKVRLGDEDDYGKQKDFVSSLCDFAKKVDGHVHLVAHPRKTASDNDAPGKVDVKGNSHITDLADNVIVLFRPDDDQKDSSRAKGRIVSDTQLYVKKNREYGREGRVHLYFDERTKKFTTKGR
jgi:twinkle protein